MKKNRLLSYTAIFAAGFLAGIVFSAWKLDGRPAPAPGPVSSSEDAAQSQQAQIQSRIAGIQRMLDADPGNLEALVQLGNDYFDTGNYEKAVEYYRKSLTINPSNPDVITDMAVAYRKIGNSQEAVNGFRKALDIDADHSIALFNLGLVLRDDLKDDKGAVEAWERFLQKAGDSPHAVMVRPWVKKLREKTGSGGDAPSNK